MSLPALPRSSPRHRAFLLTIAAAAACGGEPGSVAIGYASGVHLPNAATLAQADMDSTRRPGQARIIIATGDTGSQVESGASLLTEVERALRLSRRADIVAVVGPGGSREALQSAPMYREAGIPNVIPTATSRRLGGLRASAFVLAPSDSIQGEFIGAFATDPLRARRALLFYVPDEYGLGLAAGVTVSLAARNIALLAQIPVEPTGLCQPRRPQNPYDDVVAAALLFGIPDVVILATRTPEGACLARAVHQRVPAARYLAGDGVLVEPLLAAMAGPSLDSIYVVAFWTPGATDSASREFVTRFRFVTGRDPRSDDAMFYDATMLLAQAIRAEGPDRESVRRYLLSLGRDRPPYQGVTGPIAFTPGSPRPLIMTRIRQGRPQPVRTP